MLLSSSDEEEEDEEEVEGDGMEQNIRLCRTAHPNSFLGLDISVLENLWSVLALVCCPRVAAVELATTH